MKAWEFVKKWGGAIFAALAAILLAVLGAGWLWRKKEAEAARLKDELAVAEATKEIARLTATREEVARQVGEKDEAIADVDRQLKENRRKIVEAHEGMEGLSDGEVEDALARLGYLIPLLLSAYQCIETVC